MTWPYGPTALIAARQRSSGEAHSEGIFLERVSFESSFWYRADSPKLLHEFVYRVCVGSVE
jgi:hypothetical protein